MTRAWARIMSDPERLEAHRAAQRTPEYRARRRSDEAKRQRRARESSPEWRARRRAQRIARGEYGTKDENRPL